MKTASFAIALISLSAASLYAAESKAITDAGLAIPSIEIPAPQAPRSSQWLTLRKIQVNAASPGLNDTLVGVVADGQDMYEAVRELYSAGFKVLPFQDGRRLFVDVKGRDAGDQAVGLARYYYITKVQVGQRVYNDIFGLDKTKGNHWLTLRKIKVNEAAPSMNDTLLGIVEHDQDIDKVLRELTGGGFRASAMQDNQGGYIVMADVKGLNAPDLAVGLARYYYVTEVRVGQKVYDDLFSIR